MKSVRTKLIASILICSLFTSVLIGVIAISNSVRTAGKDAMTMMQLTGQKKTERSIPRFRRLSSRWIRSVKLQ